MDTLVYTSWVWPFVPHTFYIALMKEHMQQVKIGSFFCMYRSKDFKDIGKNTTKFKMH